MRTRARYKRKARGRIATVVRHPRKRTHVTLFRARSYIVNKIDIFKFKNNWIWISKFWILLASIEDRKNRQSSREYLLFWRNINGNARFGSHWSLLNFGRFLYFWKKIIQVIKMFVLDPTGVYWFEIVISNIQSCFFGVSASCSSKCSCSIPRECTEDFFVSCEEYYLCFKMFVLDPTGVYWKKTVLVLSVVNYQTNKQNGRAWPH